MKKEIFMSSLRVLYVLLLAPALIFAANADANYKITLDKFKVGVKMEATADKIINIDEKALSIQPGFPLKENTIYLRQKKGAKEFKWFAGSLNVEKFKRIHAFSLEENHLKVGEVVMSRFYSAPNAKAFQDETDIYFDRKYVYSTRLPKLYFLKNGQWQMLKESTPPSVIRFDVSDDATEIFTDDFEIKAGTKYVYPVNPGRYTFVLMRDGFMPYAILVMARPASELVITPHMMRADVSKGEGPKLTVNKEMLAAAKTLQETEVIYDTYSREMQSTVSLSDSADFYKSYPPQQNADVVGLDPNDEEYRHYANRYKIKRDEAYNMWRQGQLGAAFEFGKQIQRKLDSLQALPSRMYVWAVTVNPVYPMAVPEYSADLMPASVQVPPPQDSTAAQNAVVLDSTVAKDSAAAQGAVKDSAAAQNAVIPDSTATPIAAAPAAAAQPAAPALPAEKVELIFGHEGERYDFSWVGKAQGIETDTLISLIRNGKANIIVSLQNDKPLWIVRNDSVTTRHHYRYVNMEIEYNGQLYPAEGAFVLPDYILNNPEVQDWLHPKPVVESSSSVPESSLSVESSSSVPELVVIPPSSSSVDERIVRDAFHGDVVMVDSGTFRYKGRVVDMSGFAIHATEVTQKFFNEVMKRRDSTQRVEDRSKFKGDNKPVHNVTWTVAKEFCEQLNGDLPSEAQWEFAGRADNNEGAVWMLDDVPDPSAYAVYKDNSYKLGKKDSKYGPQDVAKRKPNAWGIYDMSGNVAEWTRDKHFPITFWVEKNNPTGSMFGFLKVFKGGSWKDAEKDLNLVNSDDEDPRYWSDRIGFRCVFPRDVISKKNGK